MSRGLRSPRRIGRSLILSTVIAMLGALFYAAPALAVTTCTFTADVDPGAGVVTQVEVTLGADDNTAIRNTGTDTEFTQEANLVGAVWTPCGAAAEPDIILVTGSNAGQETLRVVEAGEGTGGNFSGSLMFIDLGTGTDNVAFISADTNAVPATPETPGLNIAFGTAADGTLIVDQNNGGAADAQIDDAENISVVGGTDPLDGDVVDAQGDFDEGSVGFTDPADDVTIPGTPDGSGADEPSAGNFAAPLSFTANAGDDEFTPGDANDTYQGGAGFDFVEYVEAGASVDVDLAAGTATGGSGDDVLADIQDVTGSTFDDNLLGSGIDNALFGSCGDDFLDGREGDDDLTGDGTGVINGDVCGVGTLGAHAEGDDTIYQGTADDGADTIDGSGQSAQTALVPDAGDVLDYGDRTADLYIEPGTASGEGGCAPPTPAATCEGDVIGDVETFLAGTGNDVFVSGGGEQIFQGGAGDDNMTGDGGEDWFDFSDSAAGVTVDVVAGTAVGNGNDTFSAVDGFIGSESTDSFLDDTTTDSIYYGMGGDDTFSQGESPSTDADAFLGGDGVDTLDYSLRTVDLSICLNGENPDLTCDETDNGEGPEADFVLDDIENGNGGAGDDDITGNEANNVLTGNLGNDSVFGANGNDTFPQGAAPDGADNLAGGNGADFVDYGARTGDIRVSLGTGAGNSGEGCVPGSTVECEGDTIFEVENTNTGAGNDLVLGSAADNIINTGAGNDKVNPSDGGDILDGGGGRDSVSFETGVGVRVNLKNGTAAEIGTGAGGGLDTLERFENVSGSLRSDIIVGNGKKNRLSGLAGGDIIKGKAGADNLIGHQGRDNLNGGKGNDKANGGPGNDKCKAEQKTSC